MMRGRLSAFWLIFIRNGTGIFRAAVNRLLPDHWHIDKLLVYSQAVSEKAWKPSHEFQSLRIARIRNTLDPLFKRLVKAYPDSGFEARLISTGKECYVALSKNDVVGYAWTVERTFHISEINYRYALRPGEFFIYDCFVAAEHRGMGIYPALLAAILQDKAARCTGFSLAYIGVFSVNRSSRRGIVKAGFAEVGSIGYLRLGDRERWWYSEPLA